jgi:hypothetical protein
MLTEFTFVNLVAIPNGLSIWCAPGAMVTVLRNHAGIEPNQDITINGGNPR